MKDLWPTAAQEVAVNWSNRRSPATPSWRKYAEVFTGDAKWQGVEVPQQDTYDWPATHQLTCRIPPYFQGMSPEPGTITNIEDARVLALLGDMITTDHISPAGSFKESTPAGKYLTERQVQPREFNSYGSRRGNHEIMMRGTFANIRIKNEMLDGFEGGYTKGPRRQPDSSIYDAAMAYQAQGTPLVIFRRSTIRGRIVTRLGGEGHGACLASKRSLRKVLSVSTVQTLWAWASSPLNSPGAIRAKALRLTGR